MANYKNIPVDDETYEWVQELCEAYEMGKRSQGAMVRKLAKAEREKLMAVKLLPVKSVAAKKMGEKNRHLLLKTKA
jgi:hypothetical protein